MSFMQDPYAQMAAGKVLWLGVWLRLRSFAVVGRPTRGLALEAGFGGLFGHVKLNKLLRI
jgi:hypothetical protein